MVVGLGANCFRCAAGDRVRYNGRIGSYGYTVPGLRYKDLKERLGNIFVGYTFDKKPVYARDLKANGAMAALLKDAIKPNLVQTLEGTAAFVHGGPFANIAQGQIP